MKLRNWSFSVALITSLMKIEILKRVVHVFCVDALMQYE